MVPKVTPSNPKMIKGITLTLLSFMMTTVPLRVDLAVFSDSLKVLERDRYIGIIELMAGIKSPMATASMVATQFGTNVTPFSPISFLNNLMKM